jgi:cation diffusion facilitator family transporter
MQESHKAQKRAARLEGWVSIVVNVILFVLKYSVGVASSSLALIADSWHTLMDSITSVIVLICARISNKPADKEHPYGHGRAELIATMVIGLLLAVVSVEFIREAISRFNNRDTANFGRLAIIVTVTSIAGKELLAQLAFYLGKRHKLASLLADGHHHRSDALSSLVVLVGIIAGGNLWWMDAALGVIVALLIGYTAYKIFINSADNLLGRCAGEELKNSILEICDRVADENNVQLEPHHFHVHKYGNHQELTFHVRLPQDWQIGHGHDLLTKIEDGIMETLNIEATIHIDPKIISEQKQDGS